ncbi:hypothetical protein [Sabulibacter ruber]|uniref:hypothetical protein n=1 Tax=Sabulibacter ruber TaxID=2811901 RepID=UPI001A968DC4|nr:hypothetical protein [Sabulibacter ruber]
MKYTKAIPSAFPQKFAVVDFPFPLACPFPFSQIQVLSVAASELSLRSGKTASFCDFRHKLMPEETSFQQTAGTFFRSDSQIIPGTLKKATRKGNVSLRFSVNEPNHN